MPAIHSSPTELRPAPGGAQRTPGRLIDALVRHILALTDWSSGFARLASKMSWARLI